MIDQASSPQAEAYCKDCQTVFTKSLGSNECPECDGILIDIPPADVRTFLKTFSTKSEDFAVEIARTLYPHASKDWDARHRALALAGQLIQRQKEECVIDFTTNVRHHQMSDQAPSAAEGETLLDQHIANMTKWMREPEQYRQMIVDSSNKLIYAYKGLQSKCAAYEAIIERMTDMLEDYDAKCPDCEGEMTRSELQEGLCTDCSRHLS